jgi:integrase
MKAQHPVDLEPLELWEYAAILPKLPYHWQLVYSILWEAGIRIGEALRLKKADVVEDGIWVGRLKKKNGKPQRDLIPLPAPLLAALQAYAAMRPGKGGVFPYTTAGAWKALKLACEQAGVRKTIHPHLFRHGFGRRVAKADLGLSALDHLARLQAMMGHSSPASTSRYFRPSMAETKEIFKRIQGGK